MHKKTGGSQAKGAERAMSLAVELGKSPVKCEGTSRVVKPLTSRLHSALETIPSPCVITKLLPTSASVLLRCWEIVFDSAAAHI
jgi:hypothetical protein